MSHTEISEEQWGVREGEGGKGGYLFVLAVLAGEHNSPTQRSVG